MATASPLPPPSNAGYERLSRYRSLLRSTERLAVKKAAEGVNPSNTDVTLDEEIRSLRGELQWAILVMVKQLKDAKQARKVLNSTIPCFRTPIPHNDIFSRAFLLACAAFGKSGTSSQLTLYTSTAASYMLEFDTAWKEPSFKRTKFHMPQPPTYSSKLPQKRKRSRKRPSRSRKRTILNTSEKSADELPNPDDLPSRFFKLYKLPRCLEPLKKVEVQRLHRKALASLASEWTSSGRPRPSISPYLDISLPANLEPARVKRSRDRNPLTLVRGVDDPVSSEASKSLPRRKALKGWLDLLRKHRNSQLVHFLLATPVCKEALEQLTPLNDGVDLRENSSERSRRYLVAYCVLSAFVQHGRDADHEMLVHHVRAAVAGMFSMHWALVCREYFAWKKLHPEDILPLPASSKSVLATLTEVDEEDEMD
ncbi:hypothetical protein BT69DRAFT_1330803 [Atractiella rhizophila]|nr:hypothetical protein BT69DRAFT_1330803 [Atractiella rhizophila]